MTWRRGGEFAILRVDCFLTSRRCVVFMHISCTTCRPVVSARLTAPSSWIPNWSQIAAAPPLLSASSMMPATSSLGRNTSTISTTPGTADSESWLSRPSISSAYGLTGTTSYPWRSRYRGTSWAAFPGVPEQPTTAMRSQSSSSRSSVSSVTGMAPDRTATDKNVSRTCGVAEPRHEAGESDTVLRTPVETWVCSAGSSSASTRTR